MKKIFAVLTLVLTLPLLAQAADENPKPSNQTEACESGQCPASQVGNHRSGGKKNTPGWNLVNSLEPVKADDKAQKPGATK